MGIDRNEDLTNTNSGTECLKSDLKC